MAKDDRLRKVTGDEQKEKLIRQVVSNIAVGRRKNGDLDILETLHVYISKVNEVGEYVNEATVTFKANYFRVNTQTTLA